MKKNEIYLIILSALYLLFHQAHAQDISAVVGNPESNNTLFVTNVTGIQNTPGNPLPNDFEPLPDTPGVEVAPPPNRIPHYNNETPPDFMSPPSLEINENITVE
ncbi:MAG: hypothetical protein IJ660_02760 [Alphaproteobacteria bacterium]|nr:hypothetical protein [Alphaproteobacteria bacterium]